MRLKIILTVVVALVASGCGDSPRQASDTQPKTTRQAYPYKGYVAVSGTDECPTCDIGRYAPARCANPPKNGVCEEPSRIEGDGATIPPGWPANPADVPVEESA